MTRNSNGHKLTLIDVMYVNCQRELAAKAWIIGSALRDACEYKLAVEFFDEANRHAKEARRVMGIFRYGISKED